MRDIGTVLDNILALVPRDYKYRDSMKVAFDNIKDSARYRAPEAVHLDWFTAARNLECYLGEPDTEWKKQIEQVFAGFK